MKVLKIFFFSFLDLTFNIGREGNVSGILLFPLDERIDSRFFFIGISLLYKEFSFSTQLSVNYNFEGNSMESHLPSR